MCLLSGADQSLKHPESQRVPVPCSLVIPGDALCTQALSGPAGYLFGGTKEGCKSCPRAVSCLPLQAGRLLGVC